MEDRHRVIRLSEREIPVPQSISTAAQMTLGRLVDDDGKPAHSKHEMPAPDDREGWMRMKAASEAQYESAVRGLAGTLRSSVVTGRTATATVHVAIPSPPSDTRRAIMDIHGGAFVVGGGEACKVSAQRQADLHGFRCYGVDYRMPPEHPYPAGLDDCIEVYRVMLKQYAPREIIIQGRSAGGNLAAAMLLRAREEGLPMPAGLVLLSPQVDLTETGDTFRTNAMIDVVLPGSLRSNNLLYADGTDLSHPLLSPLFGDLAGFPPTFLQSGTRDLFLSNAVRMHRSLRKAGVEAELHVFEAMPHGGFMGGTPEDEDLQDEINRFVRNTLSGGDLPFS